MFAFGSALQLFSVEVVSSLPFGVFVAAGHILPDDNAFAVAVGVPCGGFYLDMLTYHVVAPVDGLVDVVYHRLVGWSGVQSVGPPPLVEKPVVKQVFVVELEAHHSFVAHLRGNLTHGCVTVYFIESLALVGEAHFKIIKMGAVGRPEFHVGGHADNHRFACEGFSRSNGLAAFFYRNLGHIAVSRTCRQHFDSQRIAVDVGCYFQIGDMCRVYRFKPDGLPDAGDGSVPYKFRFCHLLASRLRTEVGRVPYAHYQFIVTCGFECRSDIEAERCVTACVASYFRTIYPHVGLPVHSPEVEQDVASAP